MKGFKDFILKGNVVDMATGVVIGVAFGGVVTAMVKDLITPIIGALGGTPDFSSLFFTINNSKFMYGEFLNALISFLMTATVIYFFVITPMNKLMKMVTPEKKSDPTDKICPECLSSIPVKAKKCKYCTSVIEN